MVLVEHFENILDIKINDMFYSIINTLVDDNVTNNIYEPFYYLLNSPLLSRLQEEITANIIREKQHIRIVSEDLVEITEERLVCNLSQKKVVGKNIIFVGEIDSLLPSLDVYINNKRTPLLRRKIVWDMYRDEILEEYEQTLLVMSSSMFFFAVLSTFITLLGDDLEMDAYNCIPSYIDLYHETYRSDLIGFLEHFIDFIYMSDMINLIKINLEIFQEIYDRKLDFFINTWMPKLTDIWQQKIKEIAVDLTNTNGDYTYAETFLVSDTFKKAFINRNFTFDEVLKEVQRVSENCFYKLLENYKRYPLYVEYPVDSNQIVTLITIKYFAGINKIHKKPPINKGIHGIHLLSKLKELCSNILLRFKERKSIGLNFEKISNIHNPKKYISIQSDRHHNIIVNTTSKPLEKEDIKNLSEEYYDVVKLSQLVENVESKEFLKIQFADEVPKDTIIELLNNEDKNEKIFLSPKNGFEVNINLSMPKWQLIWACFFQFIGLCFFGGYIAFGVRYINNLQWDISYSSLISGLFFITGIMVGGRYLTIKEDQSVNDFLNCLFLVNIIWPTLFLIIGFLLVLFLN
ncbi:MAG: hypothetical protein ACTSQE_15180 [Candidatus Heimdallarchaeaceae archaeon]